MPERNDRFYGESPTYPDDPRRPAQHDRDRILYSTALRRLAGVTQVVAASEGGVFHNRLTHTLEVAQIARRLSERLVQPNVTSRAVIAAAGGLDPDVAESAALAHDLGHPPFGHIAEDVLDDLVNRQCTDHHVNSSDGFEGNPQSFRIITSLSTRDELKPGLDLTLATLNAVLKYPWARGPQGYRHRKWGVFSSEIAHFERARELSGANPERSLEAEIMDWADDIAYSLHDVEDFYVAGFIPLERLRRAARDRRGDLEFDRFIRDVVTSANRAAQERGETAAVAESEYERVAERLFALIPFTDPYTGTSLQRADLRRWTSSGITRYSSGIRIRRPTSQNRRRVEIEPAFRIEVDILKRLTWYYVINNPSLATQQQGYRTIVRELYHVYFDAGCDTSEKGWFMFPVASREQLQSVHATTSVERTASVIRIVADFIAGLTEAQALDLYKRATGLVVGSIFDPIVR